MILSQTMMVISFVLQNLQAFYSLVTSTQYTGLMGTLKSVWTTLASSLDGIKRRR